MTSFYYQGNNSPRDQQPSPRPDIAPKPEVFPRPDVTPRVTMTTFGNTTTIPDSSPAYHPHYDDSKCLMYAWALFNIVNIERWGKFSSHTIPPFIRLGIQEQFSPDNYQILTIPVGCIVCTAFGRAPTCGVIGLGVQDHPQSNNSVNMMINTKPSTCGVKWLVQVDKNMCLVH